MEPLCEHPANRLLRSTCKPKQLQGRLRPKRRLKALKGNNIMNANESWSFLARDPQRCYLESGLRRPAVLITESQTKHERNVKQCKARCLFHHIFQKHRLFLSFTWWSVATGNFKDNSSQPMLRFENHRSVLRIAFFLMGTKNMPHLMWFFFFLVCSKHLILAWKCAAVGLH